VLAAIALIVTVPTTAAGAFAPATKQPAVIDALLDPYRRPDSPGCAAAAFRSDRTVHQSFAGMADLERGVAITPSTKFFVASASKPFTAMAVVLLALDKKISLDEDVRKYVPELPSFGQAITIRHLLTHTSGLREQSNLLLMAG